MLLHLAQGTAATAVAGLLGAMRVLCKPPEAIAKQKVVCVGAGSAGMGVVRMIAAGKSCVSSCLPPAADLLLCSCSCFTGGILLALCW